MNVEFMKHLDIQGHCMLNSFHQISFLELKETMKTMKTEIIYDNAMVFTVALFF